VGALGVIGVGVIILDLEGNLEKSYARGIEKDTNNHAKAHALYQGIILVKEVNPNYLIVI